MKKFLNIRTCGYCLLLIVFIALVLIRQNQVRAERSRTIASSIAQRQEKGIPVTVKKAALEDIAEYTRLTISLNKDKQWQGFVSKDIKDALSSGQKIYKQENAAENIGTILSVSEAISLETGMFLVKVELKQLVWENSAKLIVFVQTNTFKQVINVPNDILDIKGSDFYIWKGNDGIARQQLIKISSRNGYGAIARSGINPGDILIYSGQSALRDKDHIQIISEL
ncbi:MAG: hypothetical protein V1747_08290 [Candidatus Omnitrophota bacterium]